MQEKDNSKFYSLSQAALHAKVGRQAIYVAIKKKKIKAEKKVISNGLDKSLRKQWVILKEDLDEYRASKYNREKRVFEGERLFDIAEDRWSVLHASKTLSSMLGRPIKTHRIYYLIRTGQVKAYKKGNAWVLSTSELKDLFLKEGGKNPKQLEFAQ